MQDELDKLQKDSQVHSEAQNFTKQFLGSNNYTRIKEIIVIFRKLVDLKLIDI